MLQTKAIIKNVEILLNQAGNSFNGLKSPLHVSFQHPML